jgi:isoquinoline 1-oxidoreductase beta subunit
VNRQHLSRAGAQFSDGLDQGIAVQPDNIIAQTESSVVCGLGLSLTERIFIKNGEVRESNFYGYTVMRNRDVPEIHVEVIATDNHPTGVGFFARLRAPYSGLAAASPSTGRSAFCFVPLIARKPLARYSAI